MKQVVYLDLSGTTNGTKEINAGRIQSEDVAFQADLRYPSEFRKLKSYTLNWRTRLLFESLANPCMFVTFTFDPDKYYCDDPDEDIRRANLRRVWQLFIKRFRSACKYEGIDISRFRYYVITERGDDGRLHFHALIYGFSYRTFKSRNKKGQYIDLVEFNQVTDLITKSWSNGFVFYEGVHEKNIKYVTKYLHKRRISGDYISLKSNGIGLSFLDDVKKKFFFETDSQSFHVGRKEYFLPRYLKKKIWTDENEYREMNIRLAEKIENEERKKVENRLSDKNRYYVICPDSQQMLDAAYKCDEQQPTTWKSNDGCTYFLPELKQLFEETCGFVYDPLDDTIQVYFARPEPDKLKWDRLRRRTNENFAMKFIYDLRM